MEGNFQEEDFMKKTFLTASALIAALLFFAGCASDSVAGLASSSDSVGSIRKLSKILTKDSSNQEAADVFDEIYNREMEKNLAVIENGTDAILADFAGSQGKETPKEALEDIVSKLEGREGKNPPVVTDNIAVKKVVEDMTALKSAYYDLMEIQKAVKDMPEEIGSDSVYTVDKSGEDFEKGWSKTSDAIADFYVLCGDSMIPTQGDTDLENVIAIYEKKAYPAYMSYDKSQKCKKTISKLYIQQGDEYRVKANTHKSDYESAEDDLGRSSYSTLGALSSDCAEVAYRTARYWDSGADVTSKLSEVEELAKFFDENR